MGTVDAPIYSFNSGVVSRKSLARVDLAKMKLAAEAQENLLPMVLGPAVFRPGSAYKVRTEGDAVPTGLPFVFDAATKALIEVTVGYVRFLLDGTPLTRPSVSSAITNGTFGANVGSWTDADEAGAVSQWATGGYLELTGTGTNYAIRHQQITVGAPDQNVEHGLRIIIARGPVTLRVGSSAGADDYIAETSLRTGEFSLSFTPTGDFHISLQANDDVPRLVDSIAVEAAGIVKLASPWGSTHANLRYAQSGDVLFVALSGVQQRRIERRSQRSWGVCLYQTDDGPFLTENLTATTLTPSATSGVVTLTSSRDLFKSTDVGSIWRLIHSGQNATATLAGDEQYTGTIRVTGVHEPISADTRPFRIEITGLSGTGTTVKLQRSFDSPGSYVDVESYTVNQSKTFDDNFDNQIVYYRLGIVTGGYVAGTITATLTYTSSIQKGIARIVAYTNSTTVSAEVINAFGKATATSNWSGPAWSSTRGWPVSDTFHDGRLWWGFRDLIYGSVSDAFESYSDEVVGDAGPVIRSVATGAFEGILWLLSVQRLLAGTASQEVSIRASSLDEPITPTQFTARAFSERGCANVQAAKVDARGLYASRDKKHLFEAVYDFESQDFESRDVTRLCPELLSAGISGFAVQRHPDTRVWVWLADGTAAVLTYEPRDEVVAWTPVTTATGDLIKNIVVLPGDDEDEVYWSVTRTNTSGTIQTWEKLAKLSEAIGGTLSKTSDCHTVYTAAATVTIPVGTQLAGRTVVVWANGQPISGTFLVNGSGNITLASAKTNVVAGLAYDGKFKSTKLAYAGQTGTALSKQKRVDHVALLMADVAWAGVQVGRDFSNMNGLPATRNNGPALATTDVISDYDYVATPMNGGWSPDSRLCVKISSPYCATFMGAVISLQSSAGLTAQQKQSAQNANS